MKKSLFKNLKTTVIVCSLIVLCSATFATTPNVGSNHDYQNSKMKMALQLPDDWQSKVKIEENDNQVTFKYINPGGEPVFLLSINMISETQWMVIKDQLTDAKLLSHKDGMIVYAEKTEKMKIKGANNQEFIGIASKIDEVLKSYKEA